MSVTYNPAVLDRLWRVLYTTGKSTNEDRAAILEAFGFTKEWCDAAFRSHRKPDQSSICPCPCCQFARAALIDLEAAERRASDASNTQI